jgi:tRNA(adenine34) deaminase
LVVIERHHHVELTAGGVLEPECRELLQAFFKAKRVAEPAGES